MSPICKTNVNARDKVIGIETSFCMAGVPDERELESV
jgi:hypothetical protein